MNDEAANFQMEYDWAVHDFGADSPQAHKAEVAALNYFNPARFTPVYSSPEAFYRDQI